MNFIFNNTKHEQEGTQRAQFSKLRTKVFRTRCTFNFQFTSLQSGIKIKVLSTPQFGYKFICCTLSDIDGVF